MAKNSENKKGIKIDFNLTDKQKSFFAGLFALLTLVVIIVSLSLLFANRNNDKKEETKTSQDTTQQLNDLTNQLNQNLSSLSPKDLFYQDVTFEDLDIYPSAWVDRNFSASEKTNQMVSGATGDPDGDGLSNKLEFIYGSNPKNKDSLCNGETSTSQCKGRNDKENVDAGISPLTGLPLDEEKKVFSINFQDKQVVQTLEESFDNAAKEGLDFPTLYQLSKTVDYSKDVEAIQVSTVPETRENLLDYNQYKITLVNDILGSNELQSLSRIYSLIDPQALKVQQQALELKFKEISDYKVPESAARSHKVYVFIFQKLYELVTLRLNAVQADNLSNADYQEKARTTAVSIVWGYRYLNQGRVSN